MEDVRKPLGRAKALGGEKKHPPGDKDSNLISKQAWVAGLKMPASLGCGIGNFKVKPIYRAV